MVLATHSDAIREFAWNAGRECPDQEWMLHDWDVWVQNPHYTGEPGPHPEDDCYDEPDANVSHDPPDLDDIPF